MSSTAWQVGERVLVDKEQSEPATVLYVGEVQGTHGDWVGVEFDRPGRGKHDGSHGGVRYFDCLGVGDVASFVRPGKLRRGVSMLQALNVKYRQVRLPIIVGDVRFFKLLK